MKKSGILILFTLLIVVFGTQFSSGQGVVGLDVISMPGYPDLPADSAYEGQTYTFNVVVVNNSNTVIQNSGIEIVLKADSLEKVIATATQVSLNPNDSIIITINGYNFTQADYAAGNNIVVVWPRIMAPAMSLPTDTFTTNVWFIPLNGLNDDHLIDNQISFTVYPNPASSFIFLLNESNLIIEHVRIMDAVGRLVYNNDSFTESRIDVTGLKPGYYFMIAEVKGKSYYLRFILN